MSINIKNTLGYKICQEYSLAQIVEAAQGLELHSFPEKDDSGKVIDQVFTKGLSLQDNGKSIYVAKGAHYLSGTSTDAWVFYNLCKNYKEYTGTDNDETYNNDCLSDESVQIILDVLCPAKLIEGDRLSLINE